MSDIGNRIRLNRILPQSGARSLVVAYDHALMLGPIPGTERPADRIRQFVDARVDGLLLALGTLKNCGDALLTSQSPAVIARLDWTNIWYRPNAAASGAYRTCAVATVEDAVRYGADAVATYLFLGSGDPALDAAEMRKNAQVTRACERFGVPHMIESMARGAEASNPAGPEWIRRHTRMACEVGADLVKTDYAGSPESMRSVVEGCPTPILAAGGPRLASDEQVLDMISGVAAAGCAGVVFGRNIFQAPNVAEFVVRAREVLNA